MIQLNYRDAKPICEQIKDGIRKMAYSNVFSPEEKLPSVREMASKLAINPNTIERAYEELEKEGLLYTKDGVGTFINPEYENNQGDAEGLYEQFDEVTKELFCFSVTADELSSRVYTLAKGGKANDSDK